MNLDLDAQAETPVFAQLIGITPQNVNLLRRRGTLPTRGSYGEWIFAYTQYLRKGSAASARYMAAKTADLEASAALKHTRIQHSLDALTAVYQSDLDAWAVYVRTQILAAGNAILQELALREIHVDDELILAPLRDALDRARGFPEILAQEDARGEPEDDPLETDPEQTLDGGISGSA